jgi:TctA family transporter
MTAILSGVAGALALAISVPIIKPVILAFAPPEFLMLGLLGLTFVGTLSGRSISKGLLVALIGMLLSTVGFAPRGGMARYTFDITFLMNRIDIVPVALGLFALPEIITLAVNKMPIAKIDLGKAGTKGQLLLGIKDTLREWKLVLRSSLLGIYIGMLPGVGAIVAEWAAYGLAVQMAKDKSMFGKGDVRGIIGPEASTHSVKGAELIPTMVFGIPATAGMSILLGALLIHGINPGPEMLTSNLPITFSLVWTMILANIIGALLLMQWSRQIAKLIFVRANLIVPGIILVCFMGAWMASNDIGDWYVMMPFIVVGLALKRAGLARPPLILGFVLGPVMEKNLDLSYQALGWTWVERPMVIAIFCVLLFSLFFGIRAFRKTRADLMSGAEAEHAGHSMGSDVGADKLLQIKVSAAIAAAGLALFSAAMWMARDWTYDARFFPDVVCTIGIPLAVVSLFFDVRDWRREALRRASEGAPPQKKSDFPLVLMMFGFFVFIVVLSMLIGQLLALPIAMAVYLLWWGKESWKIALGQAVAGFVFLFVVFDQIVHVSWIDSWWTPPFLN